MADDEWAAFGAAPLSTNPVPPLALEGPTGGGEGGGGAGASGGVWAAFGAANDAAAAEEAILGAELEWDPFMATPRDTPEVPVAEPASLFGEEKGEGPRGDGAAGGENSAAEAELGPRENEPAEKADSDSGSDSGPESLGETVAPAVIEGDGGAGLSDAESPGLKSDSAEFSVFGTSSMETALSVSEASEHVSRARAVDDDGGQDPRAASPVAEWSTFGTEADVEEDADSGVEHHSGIAEATVAEEAEPAASEPRAASPVAEWGAFGAEADGQDDADAVVAHVEETELEMAEPRAASPVAEWGAFGQADGQDDADSGLGHVAEAGPTTAEARAVSPVAEWGAFGADADVEEDEDIVGGHDGPIAEATAAAEAEPTAAEARAASSVAEWGAFGADADVEEEPAAAFGSFGDEEDLETASVDQVRSVSPVGEGETGEIGVAPATDEFGGESEGGGASESGDDFGDFGDFNDVGDDADDDFGDFGDFGDTNAEGDEEFFEPPPVVQPAAPTVDVLDKDVLRALVHEAFGPSGSGAAPVAASLAAFVSDAPQQFTPPVRWQNSPMWKDLQAVLGLVKRTPGKGSASASPMIPSKGDSVKPFDPAAGFGRADSANVVVRPASEAAPQPEPMDLMSAFLASAPAQPAKALAPEPTQPSPFAGDFDFLSMGATPAADASAQGPSLSVSSAGVAEALLAKIPDLSFMLLDTLYVKP